MKFSDIEYFDSPSYRIHVDWQWMDKCLEDYEINDNLIYDPDFQRGYVWGKNQQVQYIEYILRGGISGKEVFFNHPGWQHGYEGDMVLVDGKQRILAVRNFLSNKIKVFNHLFQEYTGDMPFRRCCFYFNVNNLKDPNDVIKWYISMNSGGSIHTEDDIQRAKDCLK